MMSPVIRLWSEYPGTRVSLHPASADGEVPAQEHELVREDRVEPVAAGPDVEVVARVVPDLGAGRRGRLGGRPAAGRCGRSRRSGRAPGSAADLACRAGPVRAELEADRGVDLVAPGGAGDREVGLVVAGQGERAEPRRGGPRSASVTGSPPRSEETRLRKPAAVERRIARRRVVLQRQQAGGPSRRPAAPARRPRRRRRGPPRRRARGRRPADTPQSTSRRPSTPGSRAAAAIAAR